VKVIKIDNHDVNVNNLEANSAKHVHRNWTR